VQLCKTNMRRITPDKERLFLLMNPPSYQDSILFF